MNTAAVSRLRTAVTTASIISSPASIVAADPPRRSTQAPVASNTPSRSTTTPIMSSPATSTNGGQF